MTAAMSVDAAQLSATDDSVEFPYRAISPWAIMSIVFAFLALVGILWWPVLGMAALGLAASVLALRMIGRYPDEYSGKLLAMIGLAVNGLMLAGVGSLHAYWYMTEVPDGYTRVHFYELQQPESESDMPADKAFEIDGEKVFLKGYIHPSSGSGMLRQFILVPDLGTCCFGGQPVSSDMIEVTLKGGQTVRAGFLKQKLAGEFQLNRTPREIADFDNQVLYRMKVDQIR